MAKTVNILVIDDEDSIQSILTAFLQRHFHDIGQECAVKTIGDPVQGLFELTTNSSAYDLIMLDVRLPRLSGDEIYNTLEHVNPEVLKRILFVTGYPEDLHVRFPEGQLEVLQKPFRYASFVEKIKPFLAASHG